MQEISKEMTEALCDRTQSTQEYMFILTSMLAVAIASSSRNKSDAHFAAVLEGTVSFLEDTAVEGRERLEEFIPVGVTLQ